MSRLRWPEIGELVVTALGCVMFCGLALAIEWLRA